MILEHADLMIQLQQHTWDQWSDQWFAFEATSPQSLYVIDEKSVENKILQV